MIDLHSHILPGIDDGSPDLKTSLEMAKLAVDSGTRVLACTPHIMPPTYPNTAEIIHTAITQLQTQLNEHNIALRLVSGADIHITSELISGLESGQLPTLNATRYFLFEPPHRVMPPNLVQFSARVLEAGFVPVLTHPERLSWVETHYEVFEQLDDAGLVIQLTAGSLTGRFGKAIKDITFRMLRENRVDIFASDAHNLSSRSPDMREALKTVTEEFGEGRAHLLFRKNPAAILRNLDIEPRKPIRRTTKKTGLLSRMNKLLR